MTTMHAKHMEYGVPYLKLDDGRPVMKLGLCDNYQLSDEHGILPDDGYFTWIIFLDNGYVDGIACEVKPLNLFGGLTNG